MSRRGRSVKPKSNVGIALITLAILVPLLFIGFTKSIPFKPQYEIKAAFESSNNLKKGSPVRIAGVEVGKVTKIEPTSEGSESVLVTMTVGKSGPRSTTTRARRSARASSSRATSSSTSSRAPRARRRSRTAGRSRSTRPPCRCSSTSC